MGSSSRFFSADAASVTSRFNPQDVWTTLSSVSDVTQLFESTTVNSESSTLAEQSNLNIFVANTTRSSGSFAISHSSVFLSGTESSTTNLLPSETMITSSFWTPTIPVNSAVQETETKTLIFDPASFTALLQESKDAAVGSIGTKTRDVTVLPSEGKSATETMEASFLLESRNTNILLFASEVTPEEPAFGILSDTRDLVFRSDVQFPTETLDVAPSETIDTNTPPKIATIGIAVDPMDTIVLFPRKDADLTSLTTDNTIRSEEESFVATTGQQEATVSPHKTFQDIAPSETAGMQPSPIVFDHATLTDAGYSLVYSGEHGDTSWEVLQPERASSLLGGVSVLASLAVEPSGPAFIESSPWPIKAMEKSSQSKRTDSMPLAASTLSKGTFPLFPESASLRVEGDVLPSETEVSSTTVQSFYATAPLSVESSVLRGRTSIVTTDTPGRIGPDIPVESINTSSVATNESTQFTSTPDGARMSTGTRNATTKKTVSLESALWDFSPVGSFVAESPTSGVSELTSVESLLKTTPIDLEMTTDPSTSVSISAQFLQTEAMSEPDASFLPQAESSVSTSGRLSRTLGLAFSGVDVSVDSVLSEQLSLYFSSFLRASSVSRPETSSPWSSTTSDSPFLPTHQTVSRLEPSLSFVRSLQTLSVAVLSAASVPDSVQTPHETLDTKIRVSQNLQDFGSTDKYFAPKTTLASGYAETKDQSSFSRDFAESMIFPSSTESTKLDYRTPTGVSPEGAKTSSQEPSSVKPSVALMASGEPSSVTPFVTLAPSEESNSVMPFVAVMPSEEPSSVILFVALTPSEEPSSATPFVTVTPSEEPSSVTPFVALTPSEPSSVTPSAAILDTETKGAGGAGGALTGNPFFHKNAFCDGSPIGPCLFLVVVNCNEPCPSFFAITRNAIAASKEANVSFFVLQV